MPKGTLIDVRRMLYFVDLGKAGRLGNQMFQVASGVSLAKRINSEFFLPEDINEREHDGQKCLLKYFKHNLRTISQTQIDSGSFTLFHEMYTPDAIQYYLNQTDMTALAGHFESELYFKDYTNVIKEIFTFVDEIDTFAKEYLHSLKENFPGHTVVAVHFRRGDYTETHATPMLFFEFMMKAINTYFSGQEYVFLVFSGGNPTQGNSNVEDITFCKKVLDSFPKFVFCEVNDTIRELAIMTKCDHMILTTKSTMGWWGAYLNQNPTKKIIVPRLIIGPHFNPDTFWPADFIQL